MERFLKISSLIFILFLGLSLRIYVAKFGNNVDLDSWFTAAKIVNANTCTVYQCTPYYNYGPVWFEILGMLQKICIALGNDSFISFRYSVSFFLTAVDILVILILYSQFNFLAAIFYAINPVTIIITGYHSQFDNLAIMFGLVAILLMNKGKTGWGLFILGISLATKHILFLFPVWLFFKYSGARGVIKNLLIPYITFATGFIFYISFDNFSNYINGNELSAIIKNVFKYRSGQNGILWTQLFSQEVAAKFQFYLFVISLTISGYLLRKKNLIDLFCYYLILVIIFSSGMANQYLTIPVVSISIFPNIIYGIYSLYAGLYLLVDDSGLHLNNIRSLLSWTGANGLKYSIYILICGFIFSLLRKNKPL